MPPCGPGAGAGVGEAPAGTAGVAVGAMVAVVALLPDGGPSDIHHHASATTTINASTCALQPALRGRIFCGMPRNFWACCWAP